jgi:hypothetical protein
MSAETGWYQTVWRRQRHGYAGRRNPTRRVIAVVLHCTRGVTAGTYDTVEQSTDVDPEFDLVVGPDLRRDDVVFFAERRFFDKLLRRGGAVDGFARLSNVGARTRAISFPTAISNLFGRKSKAELNTTSVNPTLFRR